MTTPPTTGPELLTVDDVASKLQVDPRTVRRYVDNGMPVLRPPYERGALRFDWKSVTEWLSQRGKTKQGD